MTYVINAEEAIKLGLDINTNVSEPIERRFVILLTAFPVVFGLLIVVLVGFIEGNTSNIWILIKSTILFVSMVTSYVLADRIDK